MKHELSGQEYQVVKKNIHGFEREQEKSFVIILP